MPCAVMVRGRRQCVFFQVILKRELTMKGTVMHALAFGAPTIHTFVRVRRAGKHRDAKGAEMTLLDEFPPLGAVHLFVFRA